jgi:hypothetical protein
MTPNQIISSNPTFGKIIDPKPNKPPLSLFHACELDIETISEANLHEHWHKSSKRHASQKWAIKAEFNNKVVPLPCVVKLSRISPRMLDRHDNLKTSFKWIVDQLAECIIRNNEPHIPYKGAGRYDDDSRIKWDYAQEKGKPQRIRIEIFT